MTQPKSFLIGLIGAGIGGSFSPQLHQAEAAAQGFELHYRLLDSQQRGFTAADLPRLLDAMALVGFHGSNVTHPFKEAIVPHLAGMSAEAREIGAVNTIIPAPGGGWWGTNTDWYGFGESLQRFLPGAAKNRVLLVGAGGAGAAVAYATLKLGVTELLIYDRDPAKSSHQAQRLNEIFGPTRATSLDVLPTAAAGPTTAAIDGIINATPIGMTGKPGLPFDPALLDPRLWVADIIYFPLETQLLHQARLRGCRVMSGGGMVVFQAAEAFRHFTGTPPNAERMLAHFLRDRAALEQGATP